MQSLGTVLNFCTVVKQALALYFYFKYDNLIYWHSAFNQDIAHNHDL